MSKKLPAHLAWPVSRSAVATALGSLASEVSLVWGEHDPRLGDIVFHATWEPKAPRLRGGPVGLGATLTVKPVLRDGVTRLREVVITHALPEALAWLSEALTTDEVWQLSTHERWWVAADGHVTSRDRW